MLAVVAALVFAAASSVAHPTSGRAEVVARSLPATWYHEEGHPAHKLFRRQQSYPQPGSPEWTKKYPSGKLSPSQTPPEWTTALNNAIAAGLIPSNVPVASASGSYRNSSGTMDPGKAPICASNVDCKDENQTYDVPDGLVAISFDDGPEAGSKELYAYLRSVKQKVTHFYIGGNILAHPDLFMEAFDQNGDDMAVHTWSHPHMPQLSNELVLAELGWTMQIIHDSTGGRLPRYWRPPFGESDTRVRAIAKHVFGLHTVIWNHDTNDWEIGRGQTIAGATSVLTKAYKGPKSPGLNILEHELTAECVKVFKDTYPMIASNGWKGVSIPDALGASWYLNAADNTSPVTDRPVAGGPNGTVTGGSSAGSSAAPSGTSTGTIAPSTTAQPGPNSAMSMGVSSALVGLVALVGSLLTI
ncbi:chitin deacetylase [Ceratobasidium sp. AG-Ba]|nr:chitin deacetylase [Ceratobasidium sp. AG-Ba]